MEACVKSNTDILSVSLLIWLPFFSGHPYIWHTTVHHDKKANPILSQLVQLPSSNIPINTSELWDYTLVRTSSVTYTKNKRNGENNGEKGCFFCLVEEDNHCCLKLVTAHSWQILASETYDVTLLQQHILTSFAKLQCHTEMYHIHGNHSILECFIPSKSCIPHKVLITITNLAINLVGLIISKGSAVGLDFPQIPILLIIGDF